MSCLTSRCPYTFGRVCIYLFQSMFIHWPKIWTQHVKCWSQVSWAEIKDPEMFLTHKKLILLKCRAQICLHPCQWAFLLWQCNPFIWHVWHIKKLYGIGVPKPGQLLLNMRSFTRSNVLYSPTLISHFLSNGVKNMHILASGTELQAVRFGYAILGPPKRCWS